MTMTKKDFEAIAAIIADAHKEFGYLSLSAQLAISAIAADLATLGAEVNPNFSQLRFLTACGIDLDTLGEVDV